MMTSGCLRVLKNFLRFNICGLETSHVCNDNVPNITQRVTAAIPEHLEYSCCYWADHLEWIPYTPTILNSVTEFMKIRLLYWLETLSLIKKVYVASSVLSIIQRWCEVSCNVMQSIIYADTSLLEWCCKGLRCRFGEVHRGICWHYIA